MQNIENNYCSTGKIRTNFERSRCIMGSLCIFMVKRIKMKRVFVVIVEAGSLVASFWLTVSWENSSKN